MRPDAIPMVGKRYGELVVLAEAGRRHYERAKSQRLVRVRCDCAAVFDVLAAHVRVGNVKRCLDCKNERNAERQRNENSTRLPDGRTIAQIAAASGLKLGTVYRRFLRGWPPEYLGVASDGPRKGYGGSVDLPERRRTAYPREVTL